MNLQFAKLCKMQRSHETPSSAQVLLDSVAVLLALALVRE
jgi:hypothetical protein